MLRRRKVGLSFRSIVAVLLVLLVGQSLVAVVQAVDPPDVDIDIKPGGDPNSINLGSKGTVTVAVLTTNDFDATTVDPPTVRFAGAAPLRWAVEDVDADGDLDLIFKFKTRGLVDLDQGSTEATLTGQTFGGQAIQGMDAVNIVP